MKRIYQVERINKDVEPCLGDIQFVVHRLSGRDRPADPKQILIVCNLVDVECEAVVARRCIPNLTEMAVGKYIVVVGWHGTKDLYQSLVDEFWEMDKDYLWLRDRVRSFRQVSRNLATLERCLEQYGVVLKSDQASRFL